MIDIKREQLEPLFEQFSITQFSPTAFLNIVKQLDVDELISNKNEEELLSFLQLTNHFYRAGTPLISDSDYDQLQAEFEKRAPEHPFVLNVESETLAQSKTVPLPEKMLSTEKAYSLDEIEKWISRVEKTALELNIDFSTVRFRVTPKLDGYAAFDDAQKLYTRGDGVRGQDITRVFSLGLKVAGNGIRGQGPGEIVVSKSYFEQNLSELFENSRNIQAALLAEKNLSPIVQQAIDDGAAIFYPFAQLPDWNGSAEVLHAEFDQIITKLWQIVDYDIDGLVIECLEPAIKEMLGATRHHHRWQIAFKVNAESAEVLVKQVIPQTSRTGRVTPVVELEPTKLSGALISRATAHHYQMVVTNGIGQGALIQLVRSGLVIPKIEAVLKASDPEIPTLCPSCGSDLEWVSDNLFCLNKTDCPAQAENTMSHFFQILGNIDGFGPATIATFYQNGIRKVSQIYQLDEPQLQTMGYKEKTIQNLLSQLQASRLLSIEDWRFLAAFGIERLGQGSSERLLEYYHLPELFLLTEEQICAIDGFAEKSAQLILRGLQQIKEEFFLLYNLGFNLQLTFDPEKSKEQADSITHSLIAGKTVVFTGTMLHASRTEMEKQAKALGAKVAKSVSGSTDFLIIGEKVGATKMDAAREKGITVVTEADYLKNYIQTV